MEVRELYAVLLVIGGLTLIGGIVSVFLRRIWITEIMVATLTGLVLGPLVLNLFDPKGWMTEHILLEEATRITLAIGLMGIALRLPRRAILHRLQAAIILLGPGMFIMGGVSGLLIWWIFDLEFWVAMMIGACLAPTDPVVASSIVTGTTAKSSLRKDVRNTLSLEAGANDGLALLLVMLPVLVLTKSAGEGLQEWAQRIFLYEVVFAVLLGMAIGWVAGHVLRWSEEHEDILLASELDFTVALSLAVLGISRLLHIDGILAVFVAGRFYAAVIPYAERVEETHFQEAVNRFFLMPIFVLLGAIIPVQVWWEEIWKLAAAAAGILLLRRLPMMILFRPFLQPVREWPSILFMGWFGPIGIAAVFYAALALDKTGNERVWPIVSFIVLCSIFFHGLTSHPFTLWYGRHVEKEDEEDHPRADPLYREMSAGEREE